VKFENQCDRGYHYKFGVFLFWDTVYILAIDAVLTNTGRLKEVAQV